MDKPFHILLIHQAFVSLDEAGGTRHAEFARQLVARGHRVTVITSPISYLTGQQKSSQSEALPEGLRILRARSYRGLHRSFLHRLLNFISFTISAFFVGLRVPDVDLVWGTSPPLFQVITAWLLARLKRVPFLFEVRDLWPAFAVAVGVLRNPPLIAASEWLERFLYRRADQMLINSPGFRAHIAARGAQSIELLPNGADASMFDPKAKGEEFRHTHKLGNKFVVLYAGAHGLSNDLGVVLQAAAQLKKNSEFAILLLGDGKDKPALMQQAAELKLGNLLFLDPLAKAEMSQALAAADACLAILKPINLYATVYPNKVFDYMAAGRPILLAIDGVIRELLDEAKAGRFVQPGDPSALADAIQKMADDPKKARRMGHAGRAYLEAHFNRPDLAAALETIIQQTIARKARG